MAEGLIQARRRSSHQHGHSSGKKTRTVVTSRSTFSNHRKLSVLLPQSKYYDHRKHSRPRPGNFTAASELYSDNSSVVSIAKKKKRNFGTDTSSGTTSESSSVISTGTSSGTTSGGFGSSTSEENDTGTSTTGRTKVGGTTGRTNASGETGTTGTTNSSNASSTVDESSGATVKANEVEESAKLSSSTVGQRTVTMKFVNGKKQVDHLLENGAYYYDEALVHPNKRDLIIRKPLKRVCPAPGQLSDSSVPLSVFQRKAMEDTVKALANGTLTAPKQPGLKKASTKKQSRGRSRNQSKNQDRRLSNCRCNCQASRSKTQSSRTIQPRNESKTQSSQVRTQSTQHKVLPRQAKNPSNQAKPQSHQARIKVIQSKPPSKCICPKKEYQPVEPKVYHVDQNNAFAVEFENVLKELNLNDLDDLVCAVLEKQVKADKAKAEKKKKENGKVETAKKEAEKEMKRGQRESGKKGESGKEAEKRVEKSQKSEKEKTMENKERSDKRERSEKNETSLEEQRQIEKLEKQFEEFLEYLKVKEEWAKKEKQKKKECAEIKENKESPEKEKKEEKERDTTPLDRLEILNEREERKAKTPMKETVKTEEKKESTKKSEKEKSERKPEKSEKSEKEKTAKTQRSATEKVQSTQSHSIKSRSTQGSKRSVTPISRQNSEKILLEQKSDPSIQNAVSQPKSGKILTAKYRVAPLPDDEEYERESNKDNGPARKKDENQNWKYDDENQKDQNDKPQNQKNLCSIHCHQCQHHQNLESQDIPKNPELPESVKPKCCEHATQIRNSSRLLQDYIHSEGDNKSLARFQLMESIFTALQLHDLSKMKIQRVKDGEHENLERGNQRGGQNLERRHHLDHDPQNIERLNHYDHGHKNNDYQDQRGHQNLDCPNHCDDAHQNLKYYQRSGRQNPPQFGGHGLQSPFHYDHRPQQNPNRRPYEDHQPESYKRVSRYVRQNHRTYQNVRYYDSDSMDQHYHRQNHHHHCCQSRLDRPIQVDQPQNCGNLKVPEDASYMNVNATVSNIVSSRALEQHSNAHSNAKPKSRPPSHEEVLNCSSLSFTSNASTKTSNFHENFVRKIAGHFTKSGLKMERKKKSSKQDAIIERKKTNVIKEAKINKQAKLKQKLSKSRKEKKEANNENDDQPPLSKTSQSPESRSSSVGQVTPKATPSPVDFTLIPQAQIERDANGATFNLTTDMFDKDNQLSQHRVVCELPNFVPSRVTVNGKTFRRIN